MKLRKISYSILLLLIITSVSIQSQDRVVDSLVNELEKTKVDTVKLNILIQISNLCSEEDILKYAEPASALAQKLIADKSPEMQLKGKHAFADACNNIGYAYQSQGDIASSMVYYQKSLQIRRDINDQRGLGDSYVNIGYTLEQKGDIPKALEHYHKALECYEKANNKKGLAYAYNNIGFIHQKQQDLPKAIENYKKSMKIRQEIGDKHGLSQSLTNIATIYKLQKNYKEALNTHLESLEIQKEMNDKSGISNSYNNIGYIYENDLDYAKALEFFLMALELREEIKEKKTTANSLNNIARIYFLKNNIPKALEIAKRSFQMANELGYPENISYSSNLLASIYKKQGNYKSAIEMYELYLKMHDSINNESVRNTSAKQQLQFEYGRRAIADSVKYAEEEKVKDAQILAQQSQIEEEKTKRWALFGGLFLVIVFSGFIFNRFKASQKQKAIIEIQKRDVELQKEIVEEKQKEIVDSINYAKRIQYTLLAHQDLLNQNIPDHFVMFQPKDIVSGDFYWATKKDHLFYLAVCDSTGHGVPGAFMSLLNTSFINEAINEKNIFAPNEIFNYVRDRLISSVSQEGAQDGMDGILICLDTKTKNITYAASHNVPVLINKKQILKLKADKMPIGKGEKDATFNLFNIDAQKGDMLYLYTDGYPDQFGGPKGKKFKYNQLNELLILSSDKSTEQQKEILLSNFTNWKGKMEQVDDILIIGIRI